MAKAAAKENQFDERRETLVVERKTSFPADIALADVERQRVRDALHRAPKDAKVLEYIRCPTGFVRHITVTKEDVERLKGA